jgi:hypothetical protein
VSSLHPEDSVSPSVQWAGGDQAWGGGYRFCLLQPWKAGSPASWTVVTTEPLPDPPRAVDRKTWDPRSQLGSVHCADQGVGQGVVGTRGSQWGSRRGRVKADHDLSPEKNGRRLSHGGRGHRSSWPRLWGGSQRKGTSTGNVLLGQPGSGPSRSQETCAHWSWPVPTLSQRPLNPHVDS